MFEPKTVVDVDGNKLMRFQEKAETCAEMLYFTERLPRSTHRLGGPAFLRYEKNAKGWYKEREMWFRNNKPHRSGNLPAMTTFFESGLPALEMWCVDGVTIREVSYFRNSTLKKTESVFDAAGTLHKTLYLPGRKITVAAMRMLNTNHRSISERNTNHNRVRLFVFEHRGGIYPSNDTQIRSYGS